MGSTYEIHRPAGADAMARRRPDALAASAQLREQTIRGRAHARKGWMVLRDWPGKVRTVHHRVQLLRLADHSYALRRLRGDGLGEQGNLEKAVRRQSSNLAPLGYRSRAASYAHIPRLRDQHTFLELARVFTSSSVDLDY